MDDKELVQLESLLQKFRDLESVDRSEWDKRESLRFDVAFQCEINGIPGYHAGERKAANVALDYPPVFAC